LAERYHLRLALREHIIEQIDVWRKQRPDARFISDLEVTKILSLVSETYTKRHHEQRSHRGKNDYGEYL
jgi:hypothetical protein